jgi:hypothetical protein
MSPGHLPQPGDSLAIDLAGPYPRSKSGNCFMLIVVDYLTKWPELFAIKRASAQAVAFCLVKEVFPRFGVPRTIVSDNGRQFVSRIFKTMCSMFGIKRKNTSFYHPQPNLAERTIKTVRSMITTNIVDSHKEWDSNLPFIAMALRSATSDSTGFSPSFLTLGREMRLPCDPTVMDGKVTPQSDVSDWAVTITRNVREAISKAQQNIKSQAARQKPYYDAKHRDQSFAKGDLVLKKAHWLSDKTSGFMSKLAPRWQGPYVVHEVCSPVTMRLSDGKSGRVLQGTFHVQELKPYVESTDPVEDEFEGSSDELNDESLVDTSIQRVLRPRGPVQNKLNLAITNLKNRRS